MIWWLKNFPLNPLSEQSWYDSNDLSKWKLQTSNQATFTRTSVQWVPCTCNLCWGCAFWNWTVQWAQTHHCCVPGQTPQHKATSGGTDPSVCRIYAGFHPSLHISSRAQHARHQQSKKKNTAAAGTWDTEMWLFSSSVQGLWAANTVRGNKGQLRVLHIESMIASSCYSVSGYFQVC